MATSYNVPIIFNILGVDQLERANKEFAKMGGGGTNSPIARATKGTKNFGFAATNASYQVQDLIVQISSGQDPMRALGQQLPQMTVGMGAWGTAVGLAAAAIPALIMAMSGTTKEAENLDESINDITEGMGDLSKITKSLDMSSWIKGFEELDETARGIAEGLLAVRIQLKQIQLEGALEEFLSFADVLDPTQGQMYENMLTGIANKMNLTVGQVERLAQLRKEAGGDLFGDPETLQEITSILGTAGEQGAVYLEQLEKLYAAQRSLATATDVSGRAASGGLLGMGEGTVEELKEIEVIAERIINPLTLARIEANDLLQAGIEGWPILTQEVETAGESFINFGTVVTAFDQSFQGMLTGVLQGTQSLQDGIKDMAKVVIAELLRILALQALTGVGGSIGTAATNILGSANGNVFNGGEHVTAYAKGGVVNSPTLFPMANGAGLMGEAGPEAVMPLTRMPDGKLGVASGGMNVTVNNNAPGAEIRTGTDSNGGLTIDVIMKSVAAAVSRGGNPVADSLERSYALNRGKALY